MIAIAGLYPELLGTYGDGGNAEVLAQRLRWRGIEVETVTVAAGAPVPESCDIYVLGGGEDGPQTLASEELAESGALSRAVDRGAAVFAVCAGFQILGTTFVAPDGRAHAGLGLLDCATRRGAGRRRVGEIVVKPEAFPVPQLTGYENHQGVTQLGDGCRPLGRVVSGSGNDGGDRTEGAVNGKVVGTYLHGPVLARNPALADLLLSWAAGALTPLDDIEIEELRDERLGAARRRFWQLGRDPSRRAIAVL